jgi:cell fate regulator YaaT (PSP1 superfamily)
MAESQVPHQVTEPWTPPASIDEARALARERFKSRLAAGEKIGACGCGDDGDVVGPDDGSPVEQVVGIRFPDSGRVYYFRPGREDLINGDWVVVTTSRGSEAGRVVLAPHLVRQAMLQGELGTVSRRLEASDVDLMEARRRSEAAAIRLFGERARSRRLSIKPIKADASFDGSVMTINYSIPDRERQPDAATLRDLAQQLARELGSRVELRQVGPRDEARLLGGLGRCGRTLCCSSWLPVFPEISMSMAKNQELPLNPSKVSGVCGRLLCCLSYENEQYRQMKAVMPKLGQPIETPAGQGMVISIHLMKELVTVRLDDDHAEITYRADELGLGKAGATAAPVQAPTRTTDTSREGAASGEHIAAAQAEESAAESAPRRRRRRRGGRRNAQSA